MYAGPVQDLIDELGRMPGVGPKSAQRIAFHLLKLPREDALRLARAIHEVKDKVAFCERCFNVAEGPLCGICSDERRDAHLLCVVEDIGDLWAMERGRIFAGLYHVLGGTLSALDGVGPDELNIASLLRRVKQGSVREDIAHMATEIEQARLITLRAADKMDRHGNKEARDLIAMAKIAVPNMAVRVLDRAMQMHGAGGLTADFFMAEAYSYARWMRIGDGPDQVHLMALGKQMIQQYGGAR